MRRLVPKIIAESKQFTHRGPFTDSIWLGVSVESNDYAWRADMLRETPAAVRFLSVEPMLGPIDKVDLTGIDWVIVGGESGPGYRPMEVAWVRDVRDRCVAAGIPFFFKQWHKKNTGRELDGRTWDEMPKVEFERSQPR
jgi:protein gp37